MSARKKNHLQALFAAVLLAAYGSAGVLGYGLHWLWNCDHCQVASTTFNSDCCGVVEGFCPAAPIDPSSVCLEPDRQRVAKTHEICAICAFLSQAQSDFIVECDLGETTLVSADPPARTSAVLPVLCGSHLARGPPVC